MRKQSTALTRQLFFFRKSVIDVYQVSHYTLPFCKTKEIKRTQQTFSEPNFFHFFSILLIFIKIFNEFGYLHIKTYACKISSQFFLQFYEFMILNVTVKTLYESCIFHVWADFHKIQETGKQKRNKKLDLHQSQAYLLFKCSPFIWGKICFQDFIPNFD